MNYENKYNLVIYDDKGNNIYFNKHYELHPKQKTKTYLVMGSSKQLSKLKTELSS